MWENTRSRYGPGETATGFARWSDKLVPDPFQEGRSLTEQLQQQVKSFPMTMHSFSEPREKKPSKLKKPKKERKSPCLSKDQAASDANTILQKAVKTSGCGAF